MYHVRVMGLCELLWVVINLFRGSLVVEIQRGNPFDAGLICFGELVYILVEIEKIQET